MKTLPFLIGAALFCGSANAQSVITRISGGEHYFYYDGELQPVFDLASPGDTIILGGGIYDQTVDLVINVPIVLIGTGTRQDSSLAYSGRTELTGDGFTDLIIASTASGTQIHGLTTTDFGLVQLAFPNGASNCVFSRCDFEDLRLGNSGFGSDATNTHVDECIIGNMNVSIAQGTLIRNSVIRTLSYAYDESNTEVWNTILLGIPTGNAGVHYENCIFATSNSGAIIVTEGSTYVNNLFVGNGGGFTYSFGPNATDGGNLPAETMLSGASGAFVDVTSTTAYSYAFNYNVSPPYAAIGSDGTDIGIYGGPLPWKEGGIPFNPHWQELSGPGSTTNGTLQNVIIRGSAQTH